jgi:hypothetical protein
MRRRVAVAAAPDNRRSVAGSADRSNTGLRFMPAPREEDRTWADSVTSAAPAALAAPASA